ncbi:MAG: tail fiber domain-containing protein, partial [Caulobacteraceae bacterium]|nr:tail fiber domain-containing protein [Caulobacteraceae bacterium]
GGINSGYFITTGSKNTILGNYTGNNGGLDIRTASNYVVLSDGDGNPRGYFDNGGRYIIGGDNGFTSSYRIGVVNTGNEGTFIFKNEAGSNQWTGWVWNASVSGNALFINFGTEGTFTGRGSILYDRTAGLTVYNTTSDYRAKDIFGPVENALQTVLQLKPYIGKMKGASIKRPMFVAHETQEVAPYAVTGEKDALDKDGKPQLQQMDHSTLVPLLTAAIQELKAEFDAYKAAHP